MVRFRNFPLQNPSEGTPLQSLGVVPFLRARAWTLLVAGAHGNFGFRREDEADRIVFPNSGDYDLARIFPEDTVDNDGLQQSMVLQEHEAMLVLQIEPAANLLTADVGVPDRE